MTVRVEFYGIPRQRAGVPAVDVHADDLSQALTELTKCLPEFGAACVAEGELAQGVTANINGDVFVSDGECRLRPGDTLLILSADAGG